MATTALKTTPLLEFLGRLYRWKASDRRLGYAFEAALTAAIQGGIPFAPDDLVVASRSRMKSEAGVSLGHFMGNEGAAGRLYELAIECRRKDAMTAIERWIGRSRFIWDGEPLRVGSVVAVPQPPKDGARVDPVRLEVTSFRKREEGGEYVVMKPVITREWKQCDACGYKSYVDEAEAGAEGVRQQRALVKFTLAELKEREKRRLAVSRMTFEVFDREDERTFEMSGLTVLEHYAFAIPDLAPLRVGEKAVLLDRFDLTRIACPTQNALDFFGAYSSVNRHAYGVETVEPILPALFELGLIREVTGAHDQKRIEITDAGRERWKRLNPDRYAENDPHATSARHSEHERDAAWERDRPAREAEARRLNEAYAAEVERTRAVREAEAREAREKAEAVTAEARKARRDRLMAVFSPERLEGVVCTFADSITAGNCEPGTLAWIERHAPGKREMDAKSLWELAVEADDGVYLVANVIRAALQRRKAPVTTARESA